MYTENKEIILKFKTGVAKELYKRQLITQKQMQYMTGLFNSEYKEENMQKRKPI